MDWRPRWRRHADASLVRRRTAAPLVGAAPSASARLRERRKTDVVLGRRRGSWLSAALAGGNERVRRKRAVVVFKRDPPPLCRRQPRLLSTSAEAHNHLLGGDSCVNVPIALEPCIPGGARLRAAEEGGDEAGRLLGELRLTKEGKERLGKRLGVVD